MTTVISTLHHSIPNVDPNKIAEEANLGWHFRSAKAIKKYSKLDSECVRPSGHSKWTTRTVDGIKVTLAPTATPPLCKRFWRWNEIAPAMTSYIKARLKTTEVIPYVHGYRALNSGLLLSELKNTPMILQHHGSKPPALRLERSFDVKGLAHNVRGLPTVLRERLLKNISGTFFVLNEAEKEYLEQLGAEATVKLRTMCVDFDDIAPASPEEKVSLRKSLGLREDSIVLTSYVGVFRETLPRIKGAQNIVRIHQKLKTVFREKIQLVATGISKRFAIEWRKRGILTYEFLPHRTFVDILRSSDAYFLPASSSYCYGGPGVAVMEALAAGVPVVTPTLAHFLRSDEVKYTGIETPWVNDGKDLDVFVENLMLVVENLEQFRSDLIRDIASRYYSWRSFVRDLEDVTAKWR